MYSISEVFGKIKYSKKERKEIKKRKLLNQSKSFSSKFCKPPALPKSVLRKEVYNYYKSTPSYVKELAMMKQMFKNPTPMKDAKIKTKLKPVKMDNFLKL
jgi:hypothetical protein